MLTQDNINQDNGTGANALPSSFGENTAAAVVQFQTKYGIRASGWVGPVTRQKLNSLYGCATTLPTQPACNNFYWFDNTSGNNCQTQKQFCGAYMYYGLQTFSTQQNCLTAFNIARGNCTPNWTCGWTQCLNGSQSEGIIDFNNCGLPISNVAIGCPTLARICTVSTQVSITSVSGAKLFIYWTNWKLEY